MGPRAPFAILPALAAALLLAAPAAGAATESPTSAGGRELAAAGERIYREGILPSGRGLTGRVQAGLTRRGGAAACAACHRRSGYGMTEATTPIRPITAGALFQAATTPAATPRIAHQLGVALRPAYDGRTLARALREGIDVTGRPMDATMPRFDLDDGELAALLAYLRTLSAQAPPGVTATDIHLATVIQPGVPAARRRAMLEVMEAFIADKNAATRSDELRRRVGTMRMQRAYRKWHLHVWELHGAADGWPAQLEAHYLRQPVFALVGGLGDEDWTPIHRFTETQRLPCLFPQARLPAVAGFYTLYLSAGVLLEARVLARHLADGAGPARIIQVYRQSGAGAAAARELRAGLPGRVDDRILAEAGPAFWDRLATERGAAGLVLWLEADDFTGAAALADAKPPAPAAPVFLSAALLADVPGGPAPMLEAAWVSPWDSLRARAGALKRTAAWLRRKGLVPGDDPVRVDTMFALSVFGDVLSHLQDSFSREYLIERVEHAVQQSLMPSSFRHVSLGPDQRFAAKGSYVVRPDGASGFRPVSGWIVP